MVMAPGCFAATLWRLTASRVLKSFQSVRSIAPAAGIQDSLVDVLSEVLRVVRLSGAIHFCAEFTRPWAILSSPPVMLAARLKVSEGSVTPFHVVTEGSCLVTSGTLSSIHIEAGDVIVFPRGDQHVMASDPELAPVPIQEIYSQPSAEQITVVKYGGSGPPARFICGFLHSDQRFDPLLKSLPAVLCVRSRDDTLMLETLDSSGRRVQPITHPQEKEWWQASVRYLMSETATPGPGNRAVLARLAESLFLELLRWQLQYAAQGHGGGWLAGLHDAQVGPALTLLHAQPDRPWTVEALAREVGVSRAALAKRFVELVGESPIQYLAGWRMHLAQHLLQESSLGVGEIAGRVGYDSDAAFNRAFRRVVGSPPATWRQARDFPAEVNGATAERRPGPPRSSPDLTGRSSIPEH
jgi:AraC-like DNA-binding protein/mannose-6-phosphate isomerase-like protein (cupin superfamily)